MVAIRSKQSGQFWTGLGFGLGAWSDNPADAAKRTRREAEWAITNFWSEDGPTRLEIVPIS